MAFDHIKQTANAPGTGNVTFTATPTQFRTFTSKYATNVVFDYVIEGYDSGQQRTALWETGRGRINVSGLLERLVVVDGSSGAGSLVNFASPTITVSVFNGVSVDATKTLAIEAMRAGGFDTLVASAGVLTVNMSTGYYRKFADLSSNTTIALTGIVNDGRVSLTFKNISGSAIALTWDTGMIVIGPALPLTLAAGKVLRVVADSISTTLSSVVIGASVQL